MSELERAHGPEKPPPAPAHPPPMGPVDEPDAGASQPLTAGSMARAVSDAGAAGTSSPAPPEALPTPSRAGQLVITELMIDPQTLSDSQGEWIELHNPTELTFEVRGCELDDGAKTPHPIALSLRVAPRAFFTIARHTNPGFTPSLVMPLSLTNSADSIALRCAGHEIDRVSYDKSFPLEPGASLSLDPARTSDSDNDRPDAWCPGRDTYGPELGTPGAPNPSCAGDADAGSDEDSESEAP
jgi:hypothetical protein